MSFRNWLLITALGGCVILPSGLRSQEQPQSKQSASQNYTPRQPAIVLDATTLRSIFEDAVKIYRDEKVAGDVTEERKERREQEDLIAQKGQEKWAMWVAIIALVQLPVSVVTLIFLWKTFRENRRTAEAAIKAANAAVGVERAYLFPKLDVFIYQGRARYRVFVENIGSTPGVIRALHIHVREHIPDGAPTYPDMGNEFSILVQRDKTVLVGKGNPEDPIPFVYESNIPPEHTQFAVGFIRYQDLFKNIRTTRFCLVVNPTGNEPKTAIQVADAPGWNDWD